MLGVLQRYGSVAQVIPFASFSVCVLVVLLWKRARRDPAILLILIGTQGGVEFVTDWVVRSATNLRTVLSGVQFGFCFWLAYVLLRERKEEEPKKE